MNTTGPFPVIGKQTAPIRGTPKIEVSHIAERVGFPRGSSGILYVPGGRSAAYKVEKHSVLVEHSLLGTATVQRMPIVPAQFGPSRERLACRCGTHSPVFHLRPGVGFVCPNCARRFCNSREEADRYRLMHEKEAIQRRLGICTDRDGWVSSVKSTKLSAQERAKLNAECDRVNAELDRLTPGKLATRLAAPSGSCSPCHERSVSVEPT